jgi:hypothetical protein
MVNSLRSSASEQMRQSLFDYLNLNRHKFDEHGQFNAAPNEQDYLPRVLLVADEFDPPKLPPKEPWLNRTQRHWAKHPEANLLRNPKTDEDLVRERYQERLEHAKKRRKYSKSKCDEHHADALKRCNKMYWGNDLYPNGSYQGCVQRAGELKDHCYKEKRYPEGKMEWANIDMDIIDEAPTADPRAITSDSADLPVVAPPMMVPQSDMNARIRAERLWQPPVERPIAANSNIQQYDLSGRGKAMRLWTPGYESSLPANDNFPRGNNAFRSKPRFIVRAHPGMGYIGGMGGGGGGGKPRLFPRYPGDPSVPVKLN